MVIIIYEISLLISLPLIKRTVLGASQIYALFVVKGIRYIRDDWMSFDGVPSIQLMGDYVGPSGVQACYIVLSQDDGAALKLYKGLDDFASGQKPLSLICETVLVP